MDASPITLQIEEAAQRSGLTKRAIRYYEEVGLLPPPGRTEGRYRIYTELHLERLRKIISLRETLGLTLQQVQELLLVEEDVEGTIQSLRSSPQGAVRTGRLQTLLALLGRRQVLIQQQREKIQALEASTNELYDKVARALATPSKE